MRIENEVALDFCDVLLKPKRSTLVSRKDVELSRTMKFRWSDFSWTGVPIISANMSSVTNAAVAAIMCDHEMLACLPKNYTGVEVARNRILSVGLYDEPKNYAHMICLDVPNG